MNRIHRLLASLALMLGALLLLAPETQAAKIFQSAQDDTPQPKYIFLFIGDGLGMPQRSAAEAFAGRDLIMNRLPAQGITTTRAADRFITGSAAAGTAMSTGAKTNIGYIGLDAKLAPVKTIAEMARDKGMKVGIVSTVSLDHATPAAFYAHVESRGMYHEIDHALAASGFDYFAGGGLKDPTGKKSEKPLGDAWQAVTDAGYTVTRDRESFQKLNKHSGKVLAVGPWLQNSKALPYALDLGPADITLAEFTAKGVELLDNPRGFFMMVEGGKIDWACHANDAAGAIHNILALDDALRVAMDFAKAHPDETLIVLTGDHECGGMTLGFAGTKYDTDFSVLKGQKVSFRKFDQEVWDPYLKRCGGDYSFNDVKTMVSENFGLAFEGDSHVALQPHEKERLKAAFAKSVMGEKQYSSNPAGNALYGGYTPLTVTITHLLNNKAGIGWTTFSHTGVPVGTSALGSGAEAFNGYYDNTDVALKIMRALGVEPKVHPLRTAVAAK